jgi:hypothetical protein
MLDYMHINEKNIELLEFIGVIMRIASFAVLSIMGTKSPLLLIWVVNSLDAVILSYCAIQRKNRPYIVLNIFWLIVSIIGVYNSL